MGNMSYLNVWKMRAVSDMKVEHLCIGEDKCYLYFSTKSHSKHSKAGHYWPISETPFKWRFADEPIVARHCLLPGHACKSEDEAYYSGIFFLTEYTVDNTKARDAETGSNSKHQFMPNRSFHGCIDI